MVSRYTRFYCLIFSIVALYSVVLIDATSTPCAGVKCDGVGSTTEPEWQKLCPFMAGSVVSNTSFLESEDFRDAYFWHEQRTLTCNRTKCQDSTHRLVCNRAFSDATLLEVGVDSLFPFLSYNKKAPLAGRQPKPQSTSVAETNKTRLAYVILVHRGYDQTVRLLKAIYHPDNWYVIHVDAKAPNLKDSLVSFADSLPNVYVLTQSFDIGWGGPEMVYATLEGIFALLDVSDKWDFVINLSSQDYPLCSDDELSSYLGTRLGKNFDVADLPPRENEKFWRSRAMYVWCDNIQCYQKWERGMPRGIDAYVGSQWFVYSREFAQYLRSDSFPQLVMAHYEHTWIADEGYFATVLMGSPFANTRIHHNLRYIIFDQIHPYTWTAADFPVLERQVDSCFSRKFDENANVLDMLDVMRNSGRKLRLP